MVNIEEIVIETGGHLPLCGMMDILWIVYVARGEKVVGCEWKDRLTVESSGSLVILVG
jgi:hypothetical protein